MKKASRALLFGLLVFTGCATDDTKWVDLPDEGQISGLLPELPAGFASSTSDDAKPLLRLVGRTVVSDIAPSDVATIVVDRTYLIPLLPTGVIRESLTLDEIQRDHLRLLPLSQWDYPGRGVLVQGLSPSDPGYPLTEFFLLEPIWNEEVSDDDRRTLESWLSRVETEAQHTAAPPKTVWIAAVGDIMLQRGVEDILIDSDDGLERIFSDLLDQMQGYDLLLGNLEGAVTISGRRTPKSYNFKFRPASLPVLKTAGFDYLSLTNNHCYDYGEAGFVDTLENLASSGIPTSGAGLAPAEALRPVRFHLQQNEVRILSMGAYPRERNGFSGLHQATVTPERAGIIWYGQEVIDALASFANGPGIDVVMVHGGHEWQRSTDAEQRSVYRSLIDAGAEIVFGSHPHVLQGSELYGTGIIYYSLGNFVFNGMDSMPYAEDSLIAAVGAVNGKLLYRRHQGVEIDGRYLSKELSGRILEDFVRLSNTVPIP